MVKPIPAVVLGSALVQTLDFCINTLRKDNPIHHSSSAPVENAVLLQDIINNIHRLIDLTNHSELKRLHDEARTDKKAKKLSEPAQQLLKLADQTKELAQPLINVLRTTQAKGTFNDPRWETARQAIITASGDWKNSDVKSSKKKFRALRRDTDSSLLLALRQYLDQSKETGIEIEILDERNGQEMAGYLGRWQSSALDAVQRHDWKSGKKKHVDEFGLLVDGLVEMERQEYFVQSMFKGLWFEELDERVNSVARPMEGTLEWLIGEKQAQAGGLLEWLGNVRGEGVFWVTGKPGAGKTTLMKHILRNPRVFPYLETWSGLSPGIISGFFALGSGTAFQKSGLGLLRSLLYESLQDMIFGPLKQDQVILQWIFSERWNQWISYGGGLLDFTAPELRRVFELLVSDTSKKFLFLIDGLDEFDEHPNEIIDLIVNTTNRAHVKFCVSSSASPIFQAAFEDRPHLSVDIWIQNDIHKYVNTTFSSAASLENLRGKLDSSQEMTIISTLVEKSSGAFLHAYLATTYLLQSLQQGDDFLALKDRAYALPPEIPDLLAHILTRLDAMDLSHIWMLHTILTQNPYPLILPLSFALTAETQATLAADVRPLKPSEVNKRTDDMRALLHYRCKNLFTVLDTSPPFSPSGTNPNSLKVTYTHRVIHTYLTATPSVFSSLPPQTFLPADQWANAHLWTLKTLDRSSPVRLAIWPPLAAALDYALRVHAATGKFPLTYTHACLSTAVFQHLNAEPGSDLPQHPAHSTGTGTSTAPAPPTRLASALDIALLFNLHVYIALKAKTCEKKHLRHAGEFSRALRRQWGRGGETAWVRGHEALRGEFGKPRAEAEALVEYYAKVVRIGVKRPGVEAGEWY
ncbi:hypothetical protein ACN47E_001205 [Coniothyrium glycines]